MTAGAAAGPGIYFAKHSSTSFGYCQASAGWDKSEFGKGTLLCIAIAEGAYCFPPPPLQK
jgi:hypothetical protein